MKPVNVFAAILIFAAGVGSGWWLSQRHYRTDADSASVKQTAEPVRNQDMRSRAAANVQWLNVESGEQARSVPAVVLKNRGIMIASLYQVFPSQRITLRERGSDATIMPRVIAASSQIPLIALSWHGSRDTGFELSDDSGSLYLGKEALLRLPNERVPAIIQSALVRDDRGVESFGVELTRDTSYHDGPLIDSETERLIGYIAAPRTIPGQVQSPPRAVDALQITTLLDNYRLPEALSNSAFNRYWSDSADGLRLAAERAYAAGNWMKAYDAATRLYGNTSDFTDRDQRLLTTAAYRHALARIDNGDTAVALDIAAAMRPNYPDSQPWCFVDARAHAYHRAWPDALHHLGYCLDQSSHLLSQESQTPGQTEGTGALLTLYREWVTHLVSDPEQTTMDKVAALQNALDREPDAHLYR
ncbi:MAG: hypothetical protein HKN70_08175, partial [Gammaproteobacteria bacterium]|nr:hypothetical protein [Gammaproteobacteria bacterium]